MPKQHRIKFTVSLTELEGRALLHALGNSIYNGTDLDVFGGSPQERHACWRAHNRIISELNWARGKASGEADSDTVQGLTFETLAVGEEFRFEDPDLVGVYQKMSKKSYRDVKDGNLWTMKARGMRLLVSIHNPREEREEEG
jgi:hypothetical protein